MVLEDETLRLDSIKRATGEEQRICTSSTEFYNSAGPKPKGRPAADVFSVKREVECCKKSYTIGTWNVGTMNHGKLEIIKGDMSRLNIDIFGISELEWTRMGHFTPDDHQILYCGQASHRRNRVAIIINKVLSNAVLGYNQKKYRMISVRL